MVNCLIEIDVATGQDELQKPIYAQSLHCARRPCDQACSEFEEDGMHQVLTKGEVED